MKKTEWIAVVTLLAVFAIGVITGYYILNVDKQLPIINPVDLNPDLVPDSLKRQGRGHTIPEYTLTDQYGRNFSPSTIEGKIYVADFFFTTCPSICKDMAVNKRKIQEAFFGDEEVAIVSHSVMPEVDSVPVLKEYAELQGADKDTWYLLTGPRKEINQLARSAYFAVLDEEASTTEHDFIHTENFVLIDKRRRIRGIYNGTSEKEIEMLIEDIKLLKKE